MRNCFLKIRIVCYVTDDPNAMTNAVAYDLTETSLSAEVREGPK